MVAGEILRTVVPEIELGNIAAVIGVGETSREALVAVRQFLAGVVTALVVEQHGIDIVFAELARIAHGAFEIGRLFAEFARRDVVEELLPVAGDIHNQVAVVVAPRGRIVVIGRLAAPHETGVRTVESKGHTGPQTRGDEFQVLLERSLALDLGIGKTLVAGLRGQRPGILVAVLAGNLSVGIDGRMDERRRVEGYVEQVLDVVVDLVLPLQVAADVDFQQRGFGDVHIDVRTDIVTGQLGRTIPRLAVVALHDAPLVVDRGRDIVAQHGRTAVDIDVHALVPGMFLRDGVDPVDIGIEVRIVPGFREADLLLRERPRDAAVRRDGVHNLHIGGCIDEFRELRRLAHGDLVTQRDFRRSHLAAFGVDQDHTVGTPHAVDGTRGGILQDRERLDLGRVHVVERTLDAVDQHQRRGASGEGADAANPKV